MIDSFLFAGGASSRQLPCEASSHRGRHLSIAMAAATNEIASRIG
jgi:hypothetical protein